MLDEQELLDISIQGALKAVKEKADHLLWLARQELEATNHSNYQTQLTRVSDLVSNARSLYAYATELTEPPPEPQET